MVQRRAKRASREAVMVLFMAGLGSGCSGPAHVPPCTKAVQAAEARKPDAHARFGAELDGYVRSFGRNWGEAYSFSGFVLVARGEEVLYARGFGKADRESGRLPGLDTVFRVGSLTK